MKINKTDHIEALDLDGKTIASFGGYGIYGDLRQILAYPEMTRVKITNRQGSWRIINRTMIGELPPRNRE